MPLTPEQCRAARGLLDWTQDELAEHAGVSRGTVRGFEAGHHVLRPDTGAAICGALETAGVVFLDADGRMGYGVRFGAATGMRRENGRASGIRRGEGASRMAGAMASAMLALRRASPASHFAIAAGLVLVAFALRVAIGGWEPGHAYVAFLPVIVFGTLLLRALPGLTAAVMGWALGVYFFVEPVRTLAVNDSGDLFVAVVFPAICACAVVGVEIVRSTIGNERSH
ncbi:DUF4118 domain-containing protein [Roseomonas sp. SSH11]|uniref:DUF4118 domain-containing protein n=1 Tax=Pararoseomonas baculiformis TaxID=2820812 RepID=A0ABS4AKY8_9PROT|nr:DUF4118 domain-containing protein [Pararoseomonas baculiformis]MBP0447687.1 DUF4118 domain-containing protein [Pararoseomonas baculiformis]